MKRVVKCDGEQMCGMSESFSRLHYHYRAANFLKKPWSESGGTSAPGVNRALQMRSLALSTVGEFENERTCLGPKSDFFFGVRNLMCGVRACENMQKRVSHGKTVRVSSSVIIMRGKLWGHFLPPS